MGEPAGIYARKGTEIRDDDGDLIATLATDVCVGDVVLPEQFIMADGSEPVVGEPLPEPINQFRLAGPVAKD